MRFIISRSTHDHSAILRVCTVVPPTSVITDFYCFITHNYTVQGAEVEAVAVLLQLLKKQSLMLNWLALMLKPRSR
jgi:hypothetical protein